MMLKKDQTVCRRYTLDEVSQVAQELCAVRAAGTIFTFTGFLGAGKTTLVREMLRACGVAGPITSPTFSYVNAYFNDIGETFYHFDCYRMQSIDEFYAAGFDEYLHAPKSTCFIEWPGVIEPLLQENVIRVTLEHDTDHGRLLCYELISKKSVKG